MKQSLKEFFGNIRTKTFHKLQNQTCVKNLSQNRELAKILYKEGLLLTYSVSNEKLISQVNLKNEYAINSFKPITKNYNNKMIKYLNLSRIDPNRNNMILKTNNGMRLLRECHEFRRGGQPICKI